MKLKFTKMHGCGNDFIMIDHRKAFLPEEDLPSLVQKLCRRKFDIGANGLMLLEKSDRADFSMRYFNRDGSLGEMCGNGARCIVKFAHDIGLITKETVFESNHTLYKGKIDDNDFVSIYFPAVSTESIEIHQIEQHTLYYLWVGVPHVIIFSDELYNLDDEAFHQFGKKIRQMTHLFPEGTNVNVLKQEANTLHIRTYERGVEEETLACGSGATAASIISHLYAQFPTEVTMQTKGGDLHIQFNQQEKYMTDLCLSGDAVIAYHGYKSI